jgi:tetratricopeptide (TPR) repeat protein
LLSDIEKRAKNELKTQTKNPYFSFKVLTTAQILRGNVGKALETWKESAQHLEKEADILRLMALGYFLNLDFENAISFLEKKQEVAYGYEDNYALGRFYVYNEQLPKALQLFGTMQKNNSEDPKIECAIASVMFQMREFEKGAEGLLAFSEKYKTDSTPDYLTYFTALSHLVSGPSKSACSLLQSIGEDSGYYKDAQLLSKHFCDEDH